MCLFKGTNKHKIAQEDIVCYKLMVKYKDRLASFYRNTDAVLGKPIHCANPMVTEGMDALDVLEGEVVHAYVNSNIYNLDLFKRIIRRSVYMAAICLPELLCELVLVKCIIPKGTIYYEEVKLKENLGWPYDIDNGSFASEIGATEIIPVEIVKTYNCLN